MEIKTYLISGMTCGSCAMRIEKTISELKGVASVNVSFPKHEITLTSSDAINPVILQQALAKLGKYRLEEAMPPKPKKPAPAWTWGLAGAIFILALFFAVQALGMQSLTAPVGFIRDRWYLVLPLIAGFSAQVWLFRSIHLLSGHGGGGAMATSGSVSSGTMFACCLHNLVPLFPILGISGVAAFFAAYQTSVFLGSIAITYAGVGYMFRKYQTMKRHHSA